jgi:hypothetical protein
MIDLIPDFICPDKNNKKVGSIHINT